MNIRLLFALEVAEDIAAKVTDFLCPKCQAYLMTRDNYASVFCWACETDDMNAREGKALLLRVKMAEKGIIIPKDKAWHLEAEKVYDPEGCFKFGMPL